MQPHQIHYRSKMASKGWLTESGDLNWPADEKARSEMARGLFGMQLVSAIDYWAILSRDDIDNTCKAPWADRAKLSAERSARRAIFATLTEDQKSAVADLMFCQARGILHSICCDIDQVQGGGLMISLRDPVGEGDGEFIRIQPGEFLDMHDEQLEWLEEFSLIFGKEESA